MPSNANIATIYRKASFWKRAVAFLIDAVIMAILLTVATLLPGYNEAWGSLMSAVSYYLYNILMDYYFQGTFGKKMLNLRVISTGKGQPSFVNAFYRNLGKMISSLPLMYGYIRILAPHRHQTIHDELGQCFVVDVSE